MIELRWEVINGAPFTCEEDEEGKRRGSSHDQRCLKLELTHSNIVINFK